MLFFVFFFNPKKKSVSGVQIALRNPRAQVTVYASGKMVCLGTRSSIIAVMACRRVARMIQKIQPYEDVKFTQFKVHNILANGAFGYRIDIEQMAEHDDLIEDVDYQPERFGGLHYRLDLLETPETKKKKKQTSHPWSHVYPTGFDSPSSISIQQQTSEPTNIVTCTVFHNGKLTITGARTEDEVYEAFRRMYDICLPFAQDQQNNTFSSDLFEKNLQKYKDEQYASALLVVQEMRHRKKKQFTTETEPENTNVETNWECDETIVQNVEWE